MALGIGPTKALRTILWSVLLAVIFAGVACSSADDDEDGDTTSPAPASTSAAAVATPEEVDTPVPVTGPRRGGTIKVGIIDSGSLDPAVAGLSQGEGPFSELVYDNLVGYDYNGVDILPDVLRSWEVSEDLTTYT